MNKNTANPFDKVIEVDNQAIIAVPTDEPFEWRKFAEERLLTGTPITAEELVNKTFDIMRAKRFDSSFEGQDHAWYCVVRPVGQDEVFAVTLGGQAVVEILDAYASTGNTRPLRVKLGFVAGGKYNGYYIFE